MPGDDPPGVGIQSNQLPCDLEWGRGSALLQCLAKVLNPLGKEAINQTGNKETKDNPERSAKLHSGD